MFGVRVVRKRDVNQTHRLFFRTAVGAGDSRNGESEIGVRSMTNTAGHIACDLLTDGSEFVNQFFVDAEQARL